jgi:hypothetical protein
MVQGQLDLEVPKEQRAAWERPASKEAPDPLEQQVLKRRARLAQQELENFK